MKEIETLNLFSVLERELGVESSVINGNYLGFLIPEDVTLIRSKEITPSIECSCGCGGSYCGEGTPAVWKEFPYMLIKEGDLCIKGGAGFKIVRNNEVEEIAMCSPNLLSPLEFDILLLKGEINSLGECDGKNIKEWELWQLEKQNKWRNDIK